METQPSPDPLYERLAYRIAGLIEHGTFRPGDRVPSVRRLSRQQDVSITTCLAAYRLLEDRGLIEARPQSGYYVRARALNAPAEPAPTRPRGGAVPVHIDDLVMRILRSMGDRDVIQLGAAAPAPQLLPWERLHRNLAAAGRRLGPRANHYTASPGLKSLRVQIARRSLAAGCALTPDDFLVTCGAQEAISLSLRATCKPGDAVAIESPTYFGVLQAIELSGLKAVEVATHPRHGLDIDALRNVLRRQKVRAVLASPNYNNPLGSCMPEDRKEALVELLTRAGVPLIEDDTFGDLCFTQERPHAAKAYDRKGLVLYCSSFSKTLAPGYRVGWVAAGKFQTEVERLKFVTNVSTATLPQIALAEFLSGGAYTRYLRRVRRTYERQIAEMTEAIGSRFPEGTRVTRPQGGFVLWVELPAAVDALDLFEESLSRGISFVPGPLFSAKKGFRNFLRLNAAYWSDEVAEAIGTLGQLAQRQL